jgi:hypothetical protein
MQRQFGCQQKEFHSSILASHFSSATLFATSQKRNHNYIDHAPQSAIVELHAKDVMFHATCLCRQAGETAAPH